MKKIKTDELLDFIEGKVSPNRDKEIRAHIVEYPVYIDIINGLLFLLNNNVQNKQHIKKKLEVQRKQALQECLDKFQL